MRKPMAKKGNPPMALAWTNKTLAPKTKLLKRLDVFFTNNPSNEI